MRPIFQFNINFVVAHKLEAKPLIEHFHLKKFIKEPFQVFKNESGIRLIISGMGASRARSAVEYMWQLDSGSFLKEGWINVGIAGHRTLDLGTCFLANKITSKETGEVYYPFLDWNTKNTEGLITVDRPEKSYVGDEAYDMEAAGFFKAASNFSETELISSIKVISDNKTSSIDNITEKLIENLMVKTIAYVEPVVSVLKKRLAILNKGLVLDRECLDMVKSIHLTVSQRNQFKSLCRRFDAMGREDELKFILNCSRITSDQLLKKLTEKLAKQAH